ncbi:MAG: hypothetical protein HY894_03070 [Deltaproteobacteria bacterium]|nr:hypothetical protein [Deltaproteobacteria bacterium]
MQVLTMPRALPVNPLLRRFSFIIFLLLVPVSAHGRDNTLNILYTGAVKGELEPCGCSPKTESGGVARLSGYISSASGGLKPYILIDAGGSMPEDTAQGRLKADALLNAFGLLNYDAAAFFKGGPLPDDVIAALAQRYGVRAVSNAGRYPGSVQLNRGRLQINVSADEKGYREGMLNVLLTGLPVSEAKYIAGWDVIVLSSGETLPEPVKSGETVIVSGASRNRELGVLTVEVDGAGRVLNYVHRWQPLGKDIKEDARVRQVLNEYGAKVARLVKDEEKKAASGGPYLGGSGCEECHKPFADIWKNTRHSGAFGALEKVGKAGDPECVKCHTTGYGGEGGFYSLSSTPGLANVQCEACHGPGRDHAADSTLPMTPTGKNICLRCHTKENSPDFDFEGYLKKIRH